VFGYQPVYPNKAICNSSKPQHQDPEFGQKQGEIKKNLQKSTSYLYKEMGVCLQLLDAIIPDW
jgi:hypothetical protein